MVLVVREKRGNDIVSPRSDLLFWAGDHLKM